MFQTSSYKILSQQPIVDENENDFSSSLSSDGSNDSLDLVLIEIGNKRKRKTKRKRMRIGRIDGFDGAGGESYQVSVFIFFISIV